MIEFAIVALYFLGILAAIAIVVYFWLSRRKGEKSLKKEMGKSKNNL